MKLSKLASIAVAVLVAANAASGDSKALPTDAVIAVSQAWARHWSAKQLDATVSLYAADAVFYPTLGPRVTGIDAIRDLFAKVLAVNSPTIRMRSVRAVIAGDLAYDSGDYEETIVNASGTTSGSGSYLIVLRREPGGWKIVEHMWTDARPGS